MSTLLESMNLYFITHYGVHLPFHALLIAAFILCLSVLFVLFYFIPGIFLWLRFLYVRIILSDFKRSGKLEYPRTVFHYTGLLQRRWIEYQGTLHEQYAINPESGAEELKAIRSTVPAEAFFNVGTLVDGPLYVEFFKHLPGIFTGMGIIGTFVGLMHGLGAFQVSEDTQVVRNSLDQLLRGVSEAFIVSLGAVFLAMVVTFFEKLVLAVLYRQVEQLCALIDSLYSPGAGAEYLERLVKSSEASASRADEVKDALIGELRQILSEISRQNLASQTILCEQFRQGLQEGVSEPLQKIVSGFHGQHEDITQNIGHAFENMLGAFSQKLQGALSLQTDGLGDAQQRTVGSLENTTQAFEQMVTRMESTSRETTAAMAKELIQAIESIGQRQQTMNDQVITFAGELRTLTQESQLETGRTLQALLSELGQQMTLMVTQLQEQTRAAAADQQSHQQRMSDATLAAMGTLSGGVQHVLEAMQGQLTQTLTGVGEHAQSSATQQQDQQRQFTAHNAQVMESLTTSVDQAMQRVSLQTTDVLVKLTQAMEDQQTAIMAMVAKMVADTQLQAQTTAAAQQNQSQTMTDATLVTVSTLSNSVQNVQRTMQSQLTDTFSTLEQYTRSMAMQQQEQQRQSTMHNQQVIENLTSGVDQAMGRVSDQTAALLTKLADTIDSQQNTIAGAIAKMVVDMQTQMHGTAAEQQGQHRQMTDATLAAVRSLSSGVHDVFNTLQGQLGGTLTTIDQLVRSTVLEQQTQQRQWISDSQQAVQHLSTSVDHVVNTLSAQTTGLLTRLTHTVETQHQTTTDAAQGMHAAIQQMSTVTTTALDRLNEGADKLVKTAEEFNQAGHSMADITQNIVQVTTQLSAAAESVNASTHTMESIVTDYGTIRQQVNEMVEALQNMVESARKEASLTADALQRIDQAAQKLTAVQIQADRYLAQVTNVIEQTHQDFSAGMRRTVGEANQQFFHYLAQAIGLLKESIGELDVALSNNARSTGRS